MLIYKYATSLNICNAQCYIYTYTLEACLRCGLCILRELIWLVSWLGFYVHAWYIQFTFPQVHPNCLSLHPSSFNEKLSYAFYGLLLLSISILYFHTLKLHFHTWWYSNHITMALPYQKTQQLSYCVLPHGCSMFRGFVVERAILLMLTI